LLALRLSGPAPLPSPLAAGGGAAVGLAMGAGQEASRGESSTALVGQILLATFDFDVFAAMMESMERGRRDASVRK